MTDTAQCERCGAPVEVGALFCARCGVDVTAAPGDPEATVATTGGTPTTPGPGRSTLRSMLREATLGEYEILDELGRGGMATVFRAHDISLDRKVAIKVMAPHLLEGEGMAERFKLEARTAAQLSHPHIIPIYAVKESASTLFFVMKYVEGRALDEIIARTGQLPIAMVKDILIKVGGALGYAHRRGVVHRDVKPGNIMIDEEGTPIVTDFGIAKVTESTGLTVTGATIGTPSYMSPEQCEAKEVAGPSDQYSLGVVAFQMLTGRLPFEGDSAVTVMYKHCHEPLPPLEDYRPDCPADVLETVKRMVEKDPADRWPSMEAAIQKLSLGGSGEAYLDPIREELVRAAKEGDFQRLAELSTGGGSLPAVEVSPDLHGAETVPVGSVSTGSGETGRGRRVGLMATVALAVTVIAGVAIMQPWSSGSSPDEPSVERLDGDPVADGSTGMDNAAGPGAPAEGLQAADDPANATAEGGEQEAPTESPTAADGPAGEPEPTGSVPASGNPTSARVVVGEVELSGLPDALEVGETARVAATARDASGRVIPSDVVERCETHGWSRCGVLWTSSAPQVATVTGEGLVTGVGEGSATISATIGGEQRGARLTVAPASPSSISLSPESLRLMVGDRERVQATAESASGQRIGGGRISWSSADEAMARVDGNGFVEAVGPGSTTVTAAAGGLRADVGVTVVVDARTAVEALVNGFASALEQEDLAAARRLFPAMSEEQAEGFRAFFDNVSDLQVRLAIDALETRDDSATAVLRGTYVFEDRAAGNQRLEIVLNAGFASTGSGEWRITDWDQIGN